MLGAENGLSRHNILISAKLLMQDDAKVKLRILHRDHCIHRSTSKTSSFLIGPYVKVTDFFFTDYICESYRKLQT